MLAFITAIRERAAFWLQLCNFANASPRVKVGDYSAVLFWLAPERPNAPQTQTQSRYPESACPSPQQTLSIFTAR
jgi:hypothetical protein